MKLFLALLSLGHSQHLFFAQHILAAKRTKSSDAPGDVLRKPLRKEVFLGDAGGKKPEERPMQNETTLAMLFLEPVAMRCNTTLANAKPLS